MKGELELAIMWDILKIYGKHKHLYNQDFRLFVDNFHRNLFLIWNNNFTSVEMVQYILFLLLFEVTVNSW